MKNYIKKETALLYRSKRIKQSLLLPLWFVVIVYYQLTIYSNGSADKFDETMFFMFRILMPFFTIVSPCILPTQYFFGIEANYIDKIMTIPLGFNIILIRKYLVYCFISFFMLILLIPAVFLGLLTPLELLASFLMAVGPFLCISLWSSIFNDRKYDLTTNTFFNWQGNTAKQYIVTLILSLVVCSVIYCLGYFFSEKTALWFMSVTGLIFVASSRVWISRLANYYNKNIADKMEKIQ